MPAVRSRQAGTDRTGYIALQSEGGTLEFRNVYLTDVK